MILVPAYSRDYKSAAQAKEAWDANKDFIIMDVGHRYYGKVCNKQDAEKHPDDFKDTYIRYNQLTQITHIGRWESGEMYNQSDFNGVLVRCSVCGRMAVQTPAGIDCRKCRGEHRVTIVVIKECDSEIMTNDQIKDWIMSHFDGCDYGNVLVEKVE